MYFAPILWGDQMDFREDLLIFYASKHESQAVCIVYCAEIVILMGV